MVLHLILSLQQIVFDGFGSWDHPSRDIMKNNAEWWSRSVQLDGFRKNMFRKYTSDIAQYTYSYIHAVHMRRLYIRRIYAVDIRRIFRPYIHVYIYVYIHIRMRRVYIHTYALQIYAIYTPPSSRSPSKEIRGGGIASGRKKFAMQ